MKVVVDSRIIELFPHTKIGILFGKDLNNAENNFELLAELRMAEKNVRNDLQLEKLLNLSKIIDWREAYRKFGCTPSQFRSSIEALLRRVLNNKDLPQINSIVDAYNLVSLKHKLPLGGSDLLNVVGDIKLTISCGEEEFRMLGSETREIVKKGEVIYKDDQEVLCRAWNYRESDKAKITNETTMVCLLVEGLEHTSKQEIMLALKDLKKLLEKYCGGSFQEFILDQDCLSCDIDFVS